MTVSLPATLELGEEIGSGAVASVHRARDPESGTIFAAKVLHASHQADPGAVDRFGREANVVQNLVHPNVVQVYGMTEIDGATTLLMELVEGPPLGQLIARKAPLPRERLVALAHGIAAGLSAAHDRGVIHRDLKPANILVDHGDVPKIADFGMARASSFAGVDRSAFAVLGTPDYMSPESVEPLAVGPRSDLYALGCILYEMGTGRPPFSGATPFALLQAHREAVPPEMPARYGPELGALVESLLAKSPADRPTSATAVVEILSDLDGRALVRPGETLPAPREGRCAQCGAPVIRGLPVCLDCNFPQAHVEAGDHTLFVVGPGEEIGDKLDAALRDRLLQWIRNNPNLGVDPAPLERFIPRLPFPFIVDISRRSGEGMRRTLEALGLELELVAGGRTALVAIRKKARNMGLRAMGIVLASMAYMWTQSRWLLGLLPLMALGAFTFAGSRALRVATRRRGEDAPTLPASITQRLDKIAQLGPTLGGRRHRESLRALTRRAVSLTDSLGDDDPMAEAEVGHALDLGLVATGRMDAIDAELAHADLREPDARVHALLHERDTWSARLLELNATLESFRSRLVMAGARKSGLEPAERLAELRARIEALEEIAS